MPLPAPVPGLVVHYSYLWNSEHMAGPEEGQRDRPCAIVAALRPADDPGETRVLVLPVTHSPPAQLELAVEIPAPVKERLRLDAERSWVVLSEWNEFIWLGPDVRRAAMPARSLEPCAQDGINLGRQPTHGIVWRDASILAFENEKLRRR